MVLWKPYWNWIKRDHRKIVCADGASALVGGFNITVNDAPVELGGRGWKDAAVRVEGPVVGEVERLFWESWAWGKPPDEVSVAQSPGRGAASSKSSSRNSPRPYRYSADRAHSMAVTPSFRPR